MGLGCDADCGSQIPLGVVPSRTATFAVDFEEPVDLQGSLEIFRRSGDDFVDRWDGKRLLRTAPARGRFIPYSCATPAGLHSCLTVTTANPKDSHDVTQVASRTFSTAPSEFEQLCVRDPVVGELALWHPGIRPVLQHDLFTALVRSISAQQVNLRWATTTRSRLAKQYGVHNRLNGEDIFSLDPQRIAEADVDDIRTLQFTWRKAAAIVDLAREFVESDLSRESLMTLDDDGVISRLIRLRGIGLWSAEWILCRTLNRPRVVAGDLGVRKAVRGAYFRSTMPSEQEVRELTAHWGASASIAQALVLHAYAVRSI